MVLPPSRWISSLMALAMIPSLPPATWAIEPAAKAPAAPEADLTPQELIRAAERAYAAAEWPAAENYFATLVRTYHDTPELSDTVRRARPLWVTARLRIKKFDEQTMGLLEEVLADPQLDPVAADELAFWRGLCHFQAGAFGEARSAFEAYGAGKQPGVSALPPAARSGRAARRAEAGLLQAVCLLQEQKPGEAAALLAPLVPALRGQKLPEAAGRAAVLRLHALVTAEDDRAALDLVRETQPRLAEVTQLVAYHTLCLQLGSRLLETGHLHDAIACLQRVWPRDRILAQQQAARARFTTRLEAIRRTPGQESMAIQLESVLNRMEREIESFTKVDSFDAALRLRIASAYRELGRPREAALVLEDMLTRLPSDAIVEKAALCLIQCWMQVERWPRAVAAADAYLEKFKRADNPDLPMVRFLRATALHADHRPHDAELDFAAVHQLHSDHALAPQALFLEGICLLEQDLQREALDAFSETRQRYPKNDVLDDCAYWSAMALSFDKHHAEARDRFRAYLKEYSDHARHATDARFRIAFSTFGLAEYDDAASELQAFITAHPGHPLGEEARLLLGDALGALGRIADSVQAYRQIDRALNERFYEEAVFRIGNVYKISEQPDALRAHFERFLADHPTSHRLAEAVYWIGQSHRQAGRPETAREAYWKALAQYGNQPEAAGIEEVLDALPRLYPGESGRDDLGRELATLAARAGAANSTLALRLRWAEARVLAKDQPERSRRGLTDLQPLIDPRRHHPRLMADCADALRESGRSTEARRLYLDLRKWHPRALEKDRAFLGLGLMALEAHQPAEALEFLARFERETIGSPLLGEVALLKAGVFEEQGRLKEAQTEYERLLDIATASRLLKARALLKIGDLLSRQQEDLKSTAYYERVYVSYGKYHAEAATAYARRAAALERLGSQSAAIEVWRELAELENLAGFPEKAQAVDRLKSLDPNWNPRASSPETSSAPPAPAKDAASSDR